MMGFGALGAAVVLGAGAAGASGAGRMAGTGMGAGASASRRWNSNTETVWGLPSSRRVKSDLLRFEITLPDLSLTLTSMTTSVDSDVKVTSCWAGVAGERRRAARRRRRPAPLRSRLGITRFVGM